MSKRTLIALLVGGCKMNGAAPALPDADVMADATPDAAPACLANTTACVGDAIVTCGADGTAANTTQCDLGCDPSGATPVCFVLEPSNLAADSCDTGASSDLTVTSGVMALDTSTGCDAIVTQTSGPAICVRRFATVSIAQGATLRVTGTRAFALVATTVFTLDGTIDASANGPSASVAAIAGPGAPFATGNGSNGTANTPSVAGGGAGGGTTGAAGSSTLAQGAGGQAGVATGMPALTPLIAGSSGGQNGAATNDTRVAAGGLGGGAVQLVSCAAMTISATGIIDVSGSGGAGGPGTTSLLAPGGGGGGGGGGTVLVESATMTVAGVIAANGGGGGGGGLQGADALTTGVSGSLGADGAPGATAAVGGDGPGEAGSGGAGGVATSAPVVGEAPTVSSSSAGAGGGAAGRIRANVRAGSSPTMTGTLSPVASTGAIAVHPQPSH